MNYSYYQPETTFTNVAPPDDGQEGDGLVPAGPLDPSLAEWGYSAFNPSDAFAYTNQSAQMPLQPLFTPSTGGESFPYQWDLYGRGFEASNDSQAHRFGHAYVPDDLKRGFQPDGSCGPYPAQPTQNMATTMPPTELQPWYGHATDTAGLQGLEVPAVSRWQCNGGYNFETVQDSATLGHIYPENASLPAPTSVGTAKTFHDQYASSTVIDERHAIPSFLVTAEEQPGFHDRRPRKAAEVGFRTVALSQESGDDQMGLQQVLHDTRRATRHHHDIPSKKDQALGKRAWYTEVLNTTSGRGSNSDQEAGWRVQFVAEDGENPARSEYSYPYQYQRKKDKRGKRQRSSEASS